MAIYSIQIVFTLPVTTQSADNAEDVDSTLRYQLTEGVAQGDKAACSAHSCTAVHYNWTCHC